MWLETSDIDLDYHLRRVRVPAPGGRRELDELIGDIAGTPLDRGRPLWEMYFVEGMAEHRFAVIGKIHHALADGVASANLMAKMMDSTRLHEGQEPDDAKALPARRDLLRAAWRDHVAQLGRLPALARETAAGIRRVRSRGKGSGVSKSGSDKQLSRHPRSSTTSSRRGAGSLPPRWRCLTSRKRASSLGITLNDFGVGNRRLVRCGSLLQRYDGHADAPLVASVPVRSGHLSREADGQRGLRPQCRRYRCTSRIHSSGCG